jgi:hypothetical protein
MFRRKSQEIPHEPSPVVASYTKTGGVSGNAMGEAVTRELVVRTADGKERSLGYYPEGYGGRASEVLDAAGVEIVSIQSDN